MNETPRSGVAPPATAPWTALGVLRLATATWGSRWLLFAALVAVVELPLVAWVAAAHLAPEIAGWRAAAGAGWTLLSHALALLGAGIVSVAVVEADAGRRPSLASALRTGGRRALPLIATGFHVLLLGLLGLVAGVGLALGLTMATELRAWGDTTGAYVLIFAVLATCGFLVAAAPVWVALPVAGAEPVAPPEALRRSRELLRGRWFAAAALSAVPLAVTVALYVAVMLLVLEHGPVVLVGALLLELLVLAPFTAVLAAVTYTSALRAEASASAPLPAAGTAPYPP